MNIFLTKFLQNYYILSFPYKILRVGRSIFLFFFFFNDINARWSFTKEVHPLKAWVGPSIVKRRRTWDFMDWVGVEGISGCGS